MFYKSIFLLTVVACLLLAPVVALAATDPKGLAEVTPFSGTSSGTLTEAITRIVNGLLGFAAVVAVIFVIIGGVRYITSQGDEDASAQAKNTVLYALLGVIVIALSAVLVNFIIRAIP